MALRPHSRVLRSLICVPDLIDVDNAIKVKDARSRANTVPRHRHRGAPTQVQVTRPWRQIASNAAGLASDAILGARQAAIEHRFPRHALLQSDRRRYLLAGDPRNPGSTVGSPGHQAHHPMETLSALSAVYTPGDTDLAWAGVTFCVTRARSRRRMTAFRRRSARGGSTTHPPFLVAAPIGIRRVVDASAYDHGHHLLLRRRRPCPSHVAPPPRLHASRARASEDRNVNLARRSVRTLSWKTAPPRSPRRLLRRAAHAEGCRLAECRAEADVLSVHTLEGLAGSRRALNSEVGR